MNARADAVAELEARLGYQFTDRDLLERALTHASAGEGAKQIPDNERMEFIGDRVLGLLAAQHVFTRFPEADEGELTARFHSIADTKACARVARSLGLGQALRIAGGETRRGARDQDTPLSDACEALLAAIYLEAGLERVGDIWLRIWREELDRPVDPRLQNVKATLQKWAHDHGKPLPVYSVIDREGPDHAPVFTVEVLVDGLEAARGVGNTRQAAEKAAALMLLEREEDR